MSDRIVWVDVETTGLNTRDDALLEVACQITDTDLNILDGAGYQAVIWWPEDMAATLRQDSVKVVQDMHDQSGLWDRLPSGVPLAKVHRELLSHVQKYAPEPRQARLAGNSVRFDAAFLKEWLPQVSAHLHYRVLDVSSLAAAADWWHGTGFYPKQGTHEAMADIRESIAEARWIRDRLACG